MKNLICTASVVLFLILTLSAHQTLAATIHVPADYTTIQGAIDVAVDGDFVLVAPDTYVENIDFLGKAITLQSESGAEVTIIDGNQSDTAVVSFVNGEQADSVLDGFTIRNGNASGLYLFVCSPTITNCVITENSATEGGGIYCWMPQGPRATITNCVIAENSATEGGGIYCYRANPTLEYSTISGNTATDKGGGIYWDSTNASPKNCIVWGNAAPIGPQLAFSYDDWPGIYDLTVSYCDVQGGEAGVYLDYPDEDLYWLEGNIDADPLFIGAGDYHLRVDSPCIDVGVDTGLYSDIDRDTRLHGAGFDLGADEYTGPRWALEIDSVYEAGSVSIDYVIWTPEPAIWVMALILTQPSIQVIPLWIQILPALELPADIPIVLPFASIGVIGFYSGLYSAEGREVSDLDWVDTGS